MGNLEKLGILVIVILVVVVGVVAITPKEEVDKAVFDKDTMTAPPEPLETPPTDGTVAQKDWPLDVPAKDGVAKDGLAANGAKTPETSLAPTVPGPGGTLGPAPAPVAADPGFKEYVIQKN